MKIDSYVYGLIDPRTRRIRYIGQSVDPDSRMRGHLSRSSNRAAQAWINELKSLAMKPDLVILQEKTNDLYCKAEKRFIKFFRQKGSGLLNVRNGGDNQKRKRVCQQIRCVETGETFQGYNQAGRSNRCSGSTIRNRCNDGKACLETGKHFLRA